jgi:hypothetical protein
MKRPLLGLGLLVLAAAPLQAQVADTPAADIRAGRKALEHSQPAVARARFIAALALAGTSRDDRFAAAIGLGRADLWLGDYGGAASAFRQADALAADAAARQSAVTGLAQALNALDYPYQAYALLAPFAQGHFRPTLEMLRALQALGWQDKSPAYLRAPMALPATGHAARQFQLLQDDMRLALGSRLEGQFGYSNDSENLDIYRVGSTFRAAARTGGALAWNWGAAISSTHVSDPATSRRVEDANLLGQWRIRDTHTVELNAGLGHSGSWQYLQGDARWTIQSSDRFGLSLAAERAPVLTTAAIAERIVDSTYSLGTNLRPAARWSLLPTYYRQTFTDGNQRDGGVLRLLLSPGDIRGTAGALGAELSTRLFHSSETGRRAYFNPTHYRATELGLVGVYSFSPRWRLRASADAGRQTIDGIDAGIYGIAATLQGRLPGNGRLELQLGRSSAASANSGGTGYWNNHLDLSLTYPL